MVYKDVKNKASTAWVERISYHNVDSGPGNGD
jgi:hypothetical protein